jgi:hypothetical protein
VAVFVHLFEAETLSRHFFFGIWSFVCNCFDRLWYCFVLGDFRLFVVKRTLGASFAFLAAIAITISVTAASTAVAVTITSATTPATAFAVARV